MLLLFGVSQFQVAVRIPSAPLSPRQESSEPSDHVGLLKGRDALCFHGYVLQLCVWNQHFIFHEVRFQI